MPAWRIRASRPNKADSSVKLEAVASPSNRSLTLEVDFGFMLGNVSIESIQFWPETDVGRVRDHNEDSFLVDKKLQLFVVCDGMGGHAAGEVASSIAARTVRETLAAQRELLDRFPQDPTVRNDVVRALENAVHAACSAVFQEGQNDESKRGMGTTLDAMLILGRRAFTAHVGDSRIYLCRQGAVHQLTEDHSLINELLKRGRLSREQIEKLQNKNAVTRAVGVYESVEVDSFDCDVLPGDKFLLCTDGLHGYFQEGELGALFGSQAKESLAKALVDLANERGGKDNITAVVVDIPEGESGADRLTREVNLKMEILHKMPLFRHLTYQELVRILNITSVENFESGQEIVREGDDGDSLYIVLSGRAAVESAGATIIDLGPGQHFGEMALIDRAQRSTDVVAREASSLLCLKRKDFFDLVRHDHSLAVKLLWSFLGVLTDRLRNTSQQLGVAKASLPPSAREAMDILALESRDLDELSDA